jgi:signal transduction histidine kinase
MEETTPAQGRPDAPWQPSGWSLRTKISIVLLLPVIVALTLAGARIQSELAQASKLSAVRDQLPVLRGTVELADLVNQEMVAAGAIPGGAPSALTSQIDAKAASIQQDADFARLAPDTGRNLNTALGKLAGLRAAGAAAGDALSKTAGYKQIVFALSELVPGQIAAASNTQLDTTANTTKLLLQMRSDLAVEETLIRSAEQVPTDREIRVGAALAAAEESVLTGQIQRSLPQDVAPRFADATKLAGERLTALQNSQNDARAGNLLTLLPQVDSEATAVNGLINGYLDSLTNTVTDQANVARSDALRDTALVLGALLGALAVALLVARSLVTPMRRLHAAAIDAAQRQLPDTVRRVRAGEDVDWRSVEPVPVHSREEIGQLARAFDDMHQQAVRLAGEQAELRKQVSEMFMTLSRRSQSLVELQLSVIEDLEADEQDPKRLDDLFRIDHIATRLRRNGENLQVLAGGNPARHGRGPITMVELLRAATSEVKDYRRISLGNAPGGAVRAEAAADVVHILAELLENATRFSPPEEKVILTADRGSDGGLLVEVVDTGLGMTAADLDAANQRLAAGDNVSPETTRRMGLFVVGRLAAPHGVTIRLRATMNRTGRTGITASVHVPGDLVIADGTPLETTMAQLEHRAPEAIGAGVSGTGSHALAINGSSHNGASLNGSSLNGTVVNGTPVSSGGSHRIQGTLSRPPEDHTPPATLGRIRPVQPPATPPQRTPIFDQLLSNWFTETPADSAPVPPPPDTLLQAEAQALKAEKAAPPAEPVAPAAKPSEWVTPTDDAWRAAESAVSVPAETAVTSAGLPTRNPGAQLAPGAAVPRAAPAPQPTDFRDPAAVRSNLARHYSGMRAARQRTGTSPEPTGEGKADPR